MKNRYFLGLAVSCLLSQSAFAITYKLDPKVGTTFTNYLFFSVTARCVISTPDPSNVIFVEVLSNSGTINGKKVNEGDKLNVTVHNGQTLRLGAEPGGKARLTNQGTHQLSASCDLL